jgi:hypothetical protein
MRKVIGFSAILFMALGFNAFSQKSVDFSYRYPLNPVSYLHKQNIHEILDIQGQSMDVYVTGLTGCNVKSAGSKNNLVNLAVTIDTLAQVVDSPQGVMGGGIGEVKGKTFNITIRNNGKVADISGAVATTFVVQGQGQSNLSGTFTDFFPVLPEGKVNVGYSWTSVDTVNVESGMNSQVTIMNSDNKFEGFEDVEGMSCAKISSTTSGTSNMKNESQGMSMQTSGNFTGTSTTWFSPEKGYFVKFNSTTKMTGNVNMPNEGYSFPVVLDIVESTDITK